MIVPGSAGPFLYGLAIGAGATAAAAMVVDAHRRKMVAAALGALVDGLAKLEQDGELGYRHMHQVGALREIAAGVRRGVGGRDTEKGKEGPVW